MRGQSQHRVAMRRTISRYNSSDIPNMHSDSKDCLAITPLTPMVLWLPRVQATLSQWLDDKIKGRPQPRQASDE